MVLFIMGLVCTGLTSAANPSFGVFQQNYQVDIKQVCFINGSLCDTCNITSIDYPNGTSIVRDITMTKRNGDFNYTLVSTSVLGKYDVNGYCTYGIDVTKPWTAYLEVTRTGNKVGASNTIIVGALLILTIICLVLGYSFKMDYWLIKSFFFFCAVLLGILSINSARIIASESSNLSTMSSAGLLIGIVLFSIFMIFMFVFAFIEIIKAMKQKEGVRWNYD